jgi:methionine aminotransferase
MNTKFPQITTTIFAEMSQLAAEYDAINLAQGFPNFAPDPKLLQCLQESLSAPVHQYALMPGNLKLRTEIAQLIKKTENIDISPQENILITAGATEGIFCTIQALVSKGDEVLILDPSYDCYELPGILVGASVKRVALNEHFLPDWDLIFNQVNSKTKLLIINTPHNPSGSIWSPSDMDQLLKLLSLHPQLLVLSDEVYAYIVFDKKHISARSNEILRERSIITSSFGKTYHVTGWKVGYLTAPKYLLDEIKKVHQFLIFSVNSPAQEAFAKYLPASNPAALAAFYKSKRDLFRSSLESSRFKLLPCDGTYFQVLDYSEISSLPDKDFCIWLVKEIGVAAVPLSAFYADKKDQKLIRLCFAKDETTLLQATEKLCKI